MALADLLKSSGTYIKWDDRGMNNPISGSIVSIVDRQPRKYQSEELDFWDDGSPKMQWVITVATDERDEDNPDDDGTRVIVVNQWSGQKKAMAAAVREYGKEPKPGDMFTAVWASGVGKAGDARVFEYTFSGAVAPSMKNIAKDETADDTAKPASTAAELAKELLAAGMSISDVVAETGLSTKVVAALKASA